MSLYPYYNVYIMIMFVSSSMISYCMHSLIFIGLKEERVALLAAWREAESGFKKYGE